VDASELLDVDMDQFAGALSLIAVRRLHSEPAELAHPDPREDPRDRRERPIEQLGDLRPRKPQPAQRRDHLDRLLAGAVGDHRRRRRAIQQPDRSLGPVATDPLRAGLIAHFGRLGGLRDRPALLEHPQDHPLALSQ
jgi:hypothetical protein